MAGRFEKDDRVALSNERERCGTVKELTEHTTGTTAYLITWDDHVVGQRFEKDLIPCPGSHTDKRLADAGGDG